MINVVIIQIQYLCIHGEILGVSYVGKKIKAEKGGGIESNIIEEYTPLDVGAAIFDACTRMMALA